MGDLVMFLIVPEEPEDPIEMEHFGPEAGGELAAALPEAGPAVVPLARRRAGRLMRDASTDPMESSGAERAHARAPRPRNAARRRLKKSVELTNQEFQAACNVLRSENCTSPQEKALILNFMSGARVHPCPYLGDLVTIKLSEYERYVRRRGGPEQLLLVETYFHMNYRTGGWGHSRRYRRPHADAAAHQFSPDSLRLERLSLRDAGLKP